jgi:hypothetical protein
MLSFKNYFQQEARKNPELNIKHSINSIMRDYYEKSPKFSTGEKNAFASFTKLPKLGINPQSVYNTPTGIYAYPLEYVLQQTGDNDSPETTLEFAGGAPYVNLFNSAGNIEIIKNITEQDLEYYLKKIEKYWNNSGFKLTQSDIDAYEYADDLAVNDLTSYIHYYFKQAKFKLFYHETPGFKLWNIARMTAMKIARRINKNSSPVWNGLFRAIGIDGFVDYEGGIIHPNEPTQAVFFNIQAVKNVKLYDNKYSPNDVEAAKVRGEKIKHAIIKKK